MLDRVATCENARPSSLQLSNATAAYHTSPQPQSHLHIKSASGFLASETRHWDVVDSLTKLQAGIT